MPCRTDTVRARVATGLFERIAEWNGYGRALYPWACGVHASEAKPADFSTTVSLFSQASFLGIRKKLFAAPAEQLTLEDLDRLDADMHVVYARFSHKSLPAMSCVKAGILHFTPRSAPGTC